MFSSRRPRLGMSVAAVAATAVAVLGGFVAPTAHAFYIQNHERITRDALTPVGVDNTAMAQILVDPPPGAREALPRAVLVSGTS